MPNDALINAIVANTKLMEVDHCTGVSTTMSCAVYGKTQDDSGSGNVIENNKDMQKKINIALDFPVPIQRPQCGISLLGRPCTTSSSFHGIKTEYRKSPSIPSLWRMKMNIPLKNM
ncbi:hypothetical protein WCU61_00710 [Pectobacterium versatile]|uniref:hypothetical protein n=1 Tax=Pectobacterium versatile TaxID=2488639 RepID=UPI003019313B